MNLRRIKILFAVLALSLITFTSGCFWQNDQEKPVNQGTNQNSSVVPEKKTKPVLKEKEDSLRVEEVYGRDRLMGTTVVRGYLLERDEVTYGTTESRSAYLIVKESPDLFYNHFIDMYNGGRGNTVNFVTDGELAFKIGCVEERSITTLNLRLSEDRKTTAKERILTEEETALLKNSSPTNLVSMEISFGPQVGTEMPVCGSFGEILSINK